METNNENINSSYESRIVGASYNRTMKCKCKKIIPIQRVNLGFKVCVDCSQTEQYGCVPLINHKTGNSIQIMSSSDAARISKMTQRRGYGTMLG